jgi:hypothetical protein
LGIRFTAILPRLTPLTDLGRPAVSAYAARSGQAEQEYIARLGEPLTPQAAGSAVLDPAQRNSASVAPASLLTSAGLSEVLD